MPDAVVGRLLGQFAVSKAAIEPNICSSYATVWFSGWISQSCTMVSLAPARAKP